MIIISVSTIDRMCWVSLTRKNKTIMLAKEIDIQRRANFSVFKIIAKGLLLLLKPLPYWQNKI